VRRIIAGKAYDTDTAELVASGSNDHELSDAWWSLYRTSAGAWFEIAAGHDGVVEEFQPLTDAEARRWLERHANRHVERYFGLAPEASAADHKGLRFSRRAFVAAIGVLECLTQATLTRFLYKLGPDFPELAGDESISKSKRLSKLIGVYDQRPERTVEGGDTLQDVVIEKAAALVRVDLLSWGDDAPEWVSDHKEFCRLLAMDGFVVTDRSIRRSLPEDVNLPAAQNELDRLLAKHSFVVPAGHLRQAVEAHADGHWASANSQIRTFLDALFDEIAARLDPNNASLGTGQPRRTQLAARGFFSRSLNEWDDDGRNFINGLFRRLSPQGSHPGLSDEEDSTFRLHIALLAARLFLSRYDSQVTP
jgi:hypothetical protein